MNFERLRAYTHSWAITTMLLGAAMGCGEVSTPPEKAPIIDGINGNGTLNDQIGPGEVANRVRNGLIISGRNLAQADVALDPAGANTALAVTERADTRLAVELPADIEEGRTYTLRASNQFGGTQVDMFVLRGEPGPPGEKGDPGEPAPFTTEDTTIPVTSGLCADLLAAMRSLDNSVIAPDVTVTIDVSNGPYTCSESLIFDHPYGDRISLIGNSGGSFTTITFEDVAGVIIRPQRRVGFINGFSFTGVDTQGNGNFDGVTALAGSSVRLGPNIAVASFSRHCFAAEDGATLVANDTIASQCGQHGYAAKRGAFIHANRTQVSQSGASGFGASQNSTIDANNSISRGSINGNGYAAGTSSTIRAQGALAEDNANDGFVAVTGSVIDANSNAQATGNGRNGFHAESGSSLFAEGTTAADNGDHGYVANFNSALDAPNTTVSNNADPDYCVFNHSYLDTRDATAGTFCILRDTLSSDGSYID